MASRRLNVLNVQDRPAWNDRGLILVICALMSAVAAQLTPVPALRPLLFGAGAGCLTLIALTWGQPLFARARGWFVSPRARAA